MVTYCDFQRKSTKRNSLCIELESKGVRVCMRGSESQCVKSRQYNATVWRVIEEN